MKKIKLITYLFMGSVLIGCGGGSSSSTSSNVPPEAEDAFFSLNENQNQEISFSASDEDGDTLSYEIIVAPEHGTFENGIYIPDAGYVGNDSFTFIANDGVSDSEPATINIIVRADFDGDNIADVLDLDDDNDGVLDVDDAFPFNANESIDTDGDGIGNNADLDDDGDGVDDIEDAFPLDRTVAIDPNVDTGEEDEVVDNIDRNDTDDNTTTTPALPLTVSISGKIEYERVNPIHSGTWSSLDTTNITIEVAKEVIVELIDSLGNTIASTSTDNNGEYVFSDIPSETEVKIRVYAKIFKENKWDVKVIDNTNDDAIYVMEGALSTTGIANSIRNLKATASTKNSAPFAILDSVYIAMEKVIDVDSQAVFPLLYMNWSVNNVRSGTYYDGDKTIMLQGDQSGDNDEYDDHIIVHEWGHYFEEKFSRADSIGGSHSSGDLLDIRVAFGEGWGNAWSAIATDDPIYFDTYTTTGWNMNIETTDYKNNPGWFSEASIQRILYDLYDSNDDDTDILSLGFKPLYDVLVGAEKLTPAFTSIFSFITALKNENLEEKASIESIVSSESIATIEDIYGLGRTNNAAAYPYHDLALGSTVNIETSNHDGSYNKLSNRQYVKFSINTAGRYTLKVEQTNGSYSDPDLILYFTSPFKLVAISESAEEGKEELNIFLEEGSYLLDIYNYSDIYNDQNIEISEYTVTVTSE
jgi:hypothetical protein